MEVIKLTIENLPENSEKWLKLKRQKVSITIPKELIAIIDSSTIGDNIVGTIKLFHTIYTEDEDKEIYNIIIEDSDGKIYYFTHEPELDYLYYVGSFDD